MNQRIFFGKNDLRFYYFRYKDTNLYYISILIASIIVCAILVFQVIIPQAEIYFSVKNEAEDLSSKIKVINNNVNFINSLDKSQLDSQLQIATQALPTDKDFVGIINSISDAAVLSGVSVSDFTFRLNTTNSSSGPAVATSQKGLLPINVIFNIEGSNDGGKRFLQEISKKIPLVEVETVSGDSASLSVNLNFFYKPLPKLSFKEEDPIPVISKDKQDLLKKLSTWQSPYLNQGGSQSGSSSAAPLF
jgi:hypothetical protein